MRVAGVFSATQQEGLHEEEIDVCQHEARWQLALSMAVCELRHAHQERLAAEIAHLLSLMRV